MSTGKQNNFLNAFKVFWQGYGGPTQTHTLDRSAQPTKTNKRDCLKQSCLFVFRAYKDTGGGDFASLRGGGATQTQKKVKLGDSNCCYLSYFSIICVLQLA